MTLEQFLTFKGTGEQMKEYEKALKDIKALKTSIRRLADGEQFEADALDVLKDSKEPKDIERYKKHEEKLKELRNKRNKKMQALKDKESIINKYTQGGL